MKGSAGSIKGLFLFLVALLAVLGLVLGGRQLVVMPGASAEGVRGAPEPGLADELRRHVERLATDIGPRHSARPEALERALAYLEGELSLLGPVPRRETYRHGARDYHNLVLEIEGTREPSEIVVVGAHYDSVALGGGSDCPGADDNASGVAAVLTLARRFAERPQERTLRFCLFVNEEPPFFGTATMGSYVHARNARARGDDVVAMLSLEMLGYYDDAPDSQSYPPVVGWFYPDTADFVAFVGNIGSRELVRRTVRSFRSTAALPSEGAALPGFVTGISWSDHWSFWEHGYPAVMVTDTAFFRNPHYHGAGDAAGTLDYVRLALATTGLETVLEDLAAAD